MTIIKKTITLSLSVLIVSNLNASGLLARAKTGLGNYFCPTKAYPHLTVAGADAHSVYGTAAQAAVRGAAGAEYDKGRDEFIIAGTRPLVAAHDQHKAMAQERLTKTQRGIRWTETLGLPLLAIAAVYSSYRNPDSFARFAFATTAVAVTSMEHILRGGLSGLLFDPRPSLGLFVGKVAFGCVYPLLYLSQVR